jgi:hypothetical protein
MELNFETAINGLDSDHCPGCGGSLNYDVQDDSIYISCGCGNFEVSTFRDKYNGNLLLYYLNHGDLGAVNQDHLNKMQNVLYRKKYVKKSLFTLKMKDKIFGL